MAEKYTVFDVETPNRFSNRMSAIGVCVIKNGVIDERFYSLVNPETFFDYFNTALTGICEEDVLFEPDFKVIWETLEPMFRDSVLVAHNAPFDLGVLSCCLEGYNIFDFESAPYLCTCRLGRKVYPSFPNHKLNTMCDILNINLDHHNAGSDAEASARLLLDYISQGCNVDKYIKTYDFFERKNRVGGYPLVE